MKAMVGGKRRRTICGGIWTTLRQSRWCSSPLAAPRVVARIAGRCSAGSSLASGLGAPVLEASVSSTIGTARHCHGPPPWQQIRTSRSRSGASMPASAVCHRASGQGRGRIAQAITEILLDLTGRAPSGDATRRASFYQKTPR
jgi:hypothetical protein